MSVIRLLSFFSLLILAKEKGIRKEIEIVSNKRLTVIRNFPIIFEKKIKKSIPIKLMRRNINPITIIISIFLFCFKMIFQRSSLEKPHVKKTNRKPAMVSHASFEITRAVLHIKLSCKIFNDKWFNYIVFSNHFVKMLFIFRS